MIRTKSALVSIVGLVAAFFNAHASPGLYGDLATSITPVGGDATFTAGSTAPASAYDAWVQFETGGVVGTPGITYRTSLDGGTTKSDTAPLGTANTIAVGPAATGVTLSLGAGNVPTGQIVTFPTEAPRRTAPVLFGWREYYKQINQGPQGGNRIVVVPGDAIDGGREGEYARVLTPGRQVITAAPHRNVNAPPGASARHLTDWGRTAIVSIWGVDPARPQDDAASYEAVDRLHEDFLQALYGTVPGIAQYLGVASWAKTQTDTVYGLELRVPLTVRSTVIDLFEPTVTPSARIHRDPPT